MTINAVIDYKDGPETDVLREIIHTDPLSKSQMKKNE